MKAVLRWPGSINICAKSADELNQSNQSLFFNNRESMAESIGKWVYLQFRSKERRNPVVKTLKNMSNSNVTFLIVHATQTKDTIKSKTYCFCVNRQRQLMKNTEVPTHCFSGVVHAQLPHNKLHNAL